MDFDFAEVLCCCCSPDCSQEERKGVNKITNKQNKQQQERKKVNVNSFLVRFKFSKQHLILIFLKCVSPSLHLSFSEPRTRRSFSRIHQQHRTAGGRNPIGQVRGRTMVKAVLRLWRRQYLDADVHGTLLRLREWDVLFQVSVSVCSVFYPSVHSVGTVTVELIANGTNITHNISFLLKQCIGT